LPSKPIKNILCESRNYTSWPFVICWWINLSFDLILENAVRMMIHETNSVAPKIQIFRLRIISPEQGVVVMTL